MVKKVIFLFISAFFLASALASASQSQYYSDLGNITSDSAVYSCWKGSASIECTTYVNLTINSTGPYYGNLSNFTLNNTADYNLTYKIDWYNGSTWVNQSQNNTWVNGSGSNYNLTGTIQFKINITLPSALSAKWNVSFNINGTYYELSSHLDSINLTSPANYNITPVQTPSFNFTLYSHNSTSQTCTLYMRLNDEGSWASYGSNSSVLNGSLTKITSSTTISQGNYTWKITCSVSGDSGSRWIYIDDNTDPLISSVSSSPSSNVATIAWITNENANSTINYGTTYSVSSLEDDDDFTTSHSIELSDLAYSTTYYYNITSCDQYGNCATNGTYSFTTSSYTGDNSGSGATTPTSSRSKTFTTIQTGATETWLVSDKNLGINRINLTVSNLSTNVRLTASKYSTLPSQVSVAKSGKVYRYLKIEATNLNQKLNLAYILLQVEKTWVQNNSLTKQDISFYKFDNSSEEWKKIITTLEAEDTTYYYLGAELTSFSYFTIAGEATTTSTTPTNTSSSTTPTTNTTSNASAGQDEQTDTGKKSSKLWIIILIVVIGIVALAVVGVIIYMQLIRKKNV